MEIKTLQSEVDAWIKKYGVRYFSELTNMAILSEEVGELARIMAPPLRRSILQRGRKERSCG